MRTHQFLAIGGLLAAGVLLPERAVAQEKEGQALYKQRCVSCHGTTGKGDGPVGKALNPKPPDFTDAKRMAQLTDAQLTEVISKGRKAMPAFGTMLKPHDIHELVEYIRTLSQAKPSK